MRRTSLSWQLPSLLVLVALVASCSSLETPAATSGVGSLDSAVLSPPSSLPTTNGIADSSASATDAQLKEQAARREELLQEWSSFILMSLEVHKAELGGQAKALIESQVRAKDPVFPAYVHPRSIEDAAANNEAMPSENKPKGGMVNADGALRPPMKDGGANQFPSIMGGDAKGEYPETGGYHPPNGYFLQTPTCDAAMRLWFNKCAFLDAPGSVFWKNSLSLFKAKGEAESSGNFIANLLSNHAAELYLGENSNLKQAQRIKDGGGDEGGGDE